MTDEEKEIFDKEIFDIVTETRIKVLKERNPDYEEVLTILEKFSHNEIIETLRKENEELKKENEDLQSKYHIVPEHYLSEAIDRCNELKAQIEKMKCCTNCKWKGQYRERKYCLECGKVKNKGWELAE